MARPSRLWMGPRLGLPSRREGSDRLRRQLGDALRLLLVASVLIGINLYVLYFRSGTSVPALLRAAQIGRQASLVPGLDGPPGTPPRLPMRRAGVQSGLRDEYLRVVEVASEGEEPLSEVLQRQGLTDLEAESVHAVLAEISGGHLRRGQRLVFYYDLENRLQAIDFERDEGLGYRLERTVAGSRTHWSRERLEGPVVTRVVAVSGVLPKEGGLYEAVVRAGEGRPLAGLLAEVFAYDVDLVAAGRPDDRFHVLVEKIYRGSHFYRYGAILAARYEGALGVLVAVRHAAPGQPPAYYSAEGEDLRRSWLHSPLRSLRPVQERPVLRLAHRRVVGVEYPAPPGTPVRALATGRVQSRSGRAPELAVVLSHGSGAETSYSRLGRLARGLTEGQTVRAGQVIGYVGPGERGRAYLLLSVRVGGRAVDPLRLAAPRGPTLPPEQRVALGLLLGQLEGREVASR
ncbi:MAG: M23 family metallopeptidase [Myxococcales bacterium]|nr:M23 family metallopeptidase [Myxococcota bacterium]MDW8282369.1 M23 family metallopeptidase [Myxococcales bacterium]